ncbi:MAG: hypothetical protein AABY32_04800 [Nanoarchaeota archaeon]
MSKINSTEKALEYLSMNHKGNISKLNIIKDDLIKELIESKVLTISEGAYSFNQKNVDISYNEYKEDKELNFFGV